MNRCARSPPRRGTQASLPQQRELFRLTSAGYRGLRSTSCSRQDREQIIQLLWGLHEDCVNSLPARDLHRIHVHFMVHMLVGLLQIRDARAEHEYARARHLLQYCLQQLQRERSTYRECSPKAQAAMRLMRFNVLFNILITYGLPLTHNAEPDYTSLYHQVVEAAEELGLQGVLRFLELMRATVQKFRSSESPGPGQECSVPCALLCISLSVLQCGHDMDIAATYLSSMLHQARESRDPHHTQEGAFNGSLGPWLSRQVLIHWKLR